MTKPTVSQQHRHDQRQHQNHHQQQPQRQKQQQRQQQQQQPQPQSHHSRSSPSWPSPLLFQWGGGRNNRRVRSLLLLGGLTSLCVVAAFVSFRGGGAYYYHYYYYYNNNGPKDDVSPTATTAMPMTNTTAVVAPGTVHQTTATATTTTTSARIGNSTDDDNDEGRGNVVYVYSCGYHTHLHRAFEPDYRPGVLTSTTTTDRTDKTGPTPTHHHHPNMDDVLVYGMYGSCPELGVPNGWSDNDDPGIVDKTVRRLLMAFPGSILVVNGEPGGDVFEALQKQKRWRRPSTGSHSNQDDGDGDDDKDRREFVKLLNYNNGTRNGTRLFQIGPYPPLNGTTVDDDDHDGDDGDDGDDDIDSYKSMYNAHSLQVFQMVIHMTRVFGPPPSRSLSASASTSTSALTSQPVLPSSTATDPSDISGSSNDIHNNNISSSSGGTNTTVWSWWTDPTQRRNNTGRFAAIAYFARNCIPHRQTAARRLATILPVHFVSARSGGCTVLSQIPDRAIPTDPHSVPSRDDFASNYVTYHDYKYCLVMENTAKHGYMTEKIVNAFLGGCLPIYYGSRKDVADVFHNGSYIYYDVYQPHVALDLIRQLEADPAEYHRMLQQTPILRDGSETMRRYFSLMPYAPTTDDPAAPQTTTTTTTTVPHSDDETLNRRIRNMMGI